MKNYRFWFNYSLNERLFVIAQIIVMAWLVQMVACGKLAFSQSPTPQPAVLVIYRHDRKHNSGAFSKPWVAINGKLLLRLPDKQYFQTEIRPGTYKLDGNIAHTLRRFMKRKRVGGTGAEETVNIRPGMTCYVKIMEIKPLLGVWRISLVRAARDQALQELPKLKRLKPKWIETGMVYKLQQSKN